MRPAAIAHSRRADGWRFIEGIPAFSTPDPDNPGSVLTGFAACAKDRSLLDSAATLAQYDDSGSHVAS